MEGWTYLDEDDVMDLLNIVERVLEHAIRYGRYHPMEPSIDYVLDEIRKIREGR